MNDEKEIHNKLKHEKIPLRVDWWNCSMRKTVLKKLLYQIQNKEKYFFDAFVILVVVCLLLFFLPRGSADGRYWIWWASAMKDNGFSNIYSSPEVMVNYFPATLYLIYVWQGFLNVFKIDFTLETVYTFKMFSVIFDMFTITFCFLLANRFQLSKKNVYWGLLLNVAFFYNSFVWGQVDTIYTFFYFLTLYFMVERKAFLALLFFLISVNFKIQSFIFLPIVAVEIFRMIFPKIKQNFDKKMVMKVSSIIFLQYLVFLPFSKSAKEIFMIVWDKGINMGDYLTWNAANFWIFVHAIPMETSKYNSGLLGISFEIWGYLFFMFIFIVVMALYVIKIWRELVTHSRCSLQQKISNTLDLECKKERWLSLSLVSYVVLISFFFFAPGMHERYSHPAILLSFLIGIFSDDYLLLIITSLAYFINLNIVFPFENSNLLGIYFFHPFLISTALYSIALISSLYIYFKNIYVSYRRYNDTP